mmetsp:Transcript_79145/g.250013  ORF Transcript_79145/g.250013 Transcript_79145/m.250013 type:complete len:200 (-) Transcript_79145:189-788(-)
MQAFAASNSAVNLASVTLCCGGTSITCRKPHIRCQSCSCFRMNHDRIDVKACRSRCPWGSDCHVLERETTSFMQTSSFRKPLQTASKSATVASPSPACCRKPSSIAFLCARLSLASRAPRPNARKPALFSGCTGRSLGSSMSRLKKPAYIRALATLPGSSTRSLPTEAAQNVSKAVSRSCRKTAGSSGRWSSSPSEAGA